MTRRLVAALLACCLMAACSDEGGAEPTDSGTEATTTPTTTAQASDAPTEPPAGTEIVVADSEFGPMLFNKSKQAIYLFDVETTDEPKCYGDCAKAWPPGAHRR
jgi:predicted lipoprotein with Yx(FWY)xxD motif